MADNTTLATATGGDVIRDKDRAGVKTQIVALDLNPAGAETLMAGTLPVSTVQQVIAGASISIAPGLGDTGWVATNGAERVIFTVDNTIAANAYGGPPAVAFYRSSDGGASSEALAVVRLSDLSRAVSFYLATGANIETSFNGNCAGADSVKAAIMVAHTTNALTIATKFSRDAANSALAAIPPPLIKFSQGTAGYIVQALKDSGRASKSLTLDSYAVAATAETIMTMGMSSSGAAPVTGTSYSVTATTRLRIQHISACLHTIAGNTVAVNVIVRIRVNNSGAAIVTSPLQLILPIQGIAAANQAGIPQHVDFPDGFELFAGAGIAVTVACSGYVATTAAPKVDITITGYEY